MKILSGAGLRELVYRIDSRRPERRTRTTEATLDARQIFILPTRNGLLFALVLAVLLLAAINYENALVYLLTFALAALSIVSFLHTQRNLLGLRITATGCDPVFAGSTAVFHVCVHNLDGARTGLRLDARVSSTPPFDVPTADTRNVALAITAARRGWLECPDFELKTHYPLGIAHAWSRRLRLSARCLVYPQPADSEVYASLAQSVGDGGSAHGREGDDFAGLRAYRPGDPLARINWKTLARGQGMHTKEFGAPSADSVWIEWDAFAPADTETRLRLMTRALLYADETGMRYGLRLPGHVLEPDGGVSHRAHCLEALALHEDRT